MCDPSDESKEKKQTGQMKAEARKEYERQSGKSTKLKAGSGGHHMSYAPETILFGFALPGEWPRSVTCLASERLQDMNQSPFKDLKNENSTPLASKVNQP